MVKWYSNIFKRQQVPKVKYNMAGKASKVWKVYYRRKGQRILVLECMQCKTFFWVDKWDFKNKYNSSFLFTQCKKYEKRPELL